MYQERKSLSCSNINMRFLSAVALKEILQHEKRELFECLRVSGEKELELFKY